MQEFLISCREALADRYAIGREIGHGAMAVVCRAHDVRHNRNVAIKFLRPEVANALGPARFLKEIEIIARLQHPHILPLFDSGEVEGVLYYVMPLVEGESLRDRIRREGPLPVEEALAIAREVAAALAHAHAQDVVHRDIKPENILLSSGQALVADFGIARAITEAAEGRLTSSGIAVGTPLYMSPEQASSDAPLDGRSDIYSLGCVLFEMLAGEPPFTGRTPQAVIARHVQERLPSLEVLRPNLSVPVVLLVEKALAKVPADRFATASDMIAALEDPTTLGFERPGASEGRWKRTGTLAAGLALIAAVLLTIFGWPGAGSLDPNRIVVFPLIERGFDTPPGDLGYGVAVMIEGALEHAEPLRWIDGWEYLDVDQRVNPERVSASDKQALAHERGARFHLSGILQSHQDSITVSLRLHDVAGDSLMGQSSITAATDDAALHQVGIDAVKDLLPRLLDPGREVDLNALRERDASALALWIQGERLYRRSMFAEALESYQRAVQEDSALVFAAIKGAQAASWQVRPEAEPLASLAIERDSLLPPRYSDFAHGLHDYLTGRADSAVSWLERALTRGPDWAEGHMALGEVYYHLLPSRSALDSLASAAFEVAAAADSGFAPPLVHLTEIAIRRGDIARATELLARFRRFEPQREIAEYLSLMLTCAEEGTEAVDWSEAVRQNALAVLRAGRSLSAAGAHMSCAERAFDALVADPSPIAEKWGALLGLDGLWVALGREAEAIALVDSAVAAGTGAAMSLHVVGALVSPELRSKAAAVESFLIERVGERYEDVEALTPQTKWLMGAWHVARGDRERASSFQAALARQAATTGDRRARLYADALAAQVALSAGDSVDALRRLSSLLPTGPRSAVAWEYGEPLPVERLKLAELLHARGEFEASIRVADGFDHAEPAVYVFFLPSSLALRYRSAVAANRMDLVGRYGDRLTTLGRTDLIEDDLATPTGGAR